MELHSIPPTLDLNGVRRTLKQWAAHVVHSEEAQEALVNRTVAAAADNPFDLPEDEPVDRALMSLMLRIAQTEMAGKPAHQIAPVEHKNTGAL